LSHCDFSYEHYLNTLKSFKKDHSFSAYSNFGNKDVILRHDVDFTLESAFEMAKLENGIDTQSTYFLLFHCNLYNIFSAESTRLIKKILGLGHKIGLHYDSNYFLENNLNPNEVIIDEIETMKKHFGSQINVITAHNPSITAKLEIHLPSDIIDEDSVKFKTNRKYLSDSVQNWREGCFCNYIDENRLNLLIHLVWWTRDNKNRIEILENLVGGEMDIHKKEIESLKKFQDDYLNKLKIIEK